MTRKTSQTGHAGKYDEICERLSLDLKASAVVLIVVDGRHGHGMSVSVDPAKPGAVAMATGGELAQLIRNVADQLDAGEAPGGVRGTVIVGEESS
jgi:hypothetical protein